MNRTFVVNTNPIAPIAAWEVSPCAEIPDTDGGSEVEAFETMVEARNAADAVGGTTFWGVYSRLSDEAIKANLGPPVIHLKDFDSYDEAVRFVQLFNGVNDDD